MGHAYTPGLRVAPRARITRERRLPLPGRVLVESGDSVEAGTLVAETHLPGDVTTLHVANLLGLDAQDLKEAMVAGEGAQVEKEQVIARGGGFLGFFKGEVRSPLKGTIESISKVTGQVLLRGLPQPISVDAYVRGRVASIFPAEGVAIATGVALIQGIFGIGGETRGPIRLVVAAAEEAIDGRALPGDARGAILVGGAFATLADIRAAIAAGASALVVGGVGYATLTELLGHPIGVAVTGAERIGLTLVVTEGFGRIPIAARTFALLGAHAGHEASVNGATQIRAGVIRPEILIPLKPGETIPASADDDAGSIEKGSAVRIIREPDFGQLGTVTALPAELCNLQSETRVRVAEVRLGDGSIRVVPRSNLERIQE